MATSIEDPDALVAAAGKADLVSSQDAFSLLCGGGWIGDAQAKTRSLLQIIEGKVKGEPVIFHQFIAVLRMLPGLSQLASQVQANYGMCMLSAQFFCWKFYLVMVTDTRIVLQDIPLPSAPLPSADEEMVTDKADSNECDDGACEAASSQGLFYYTGFFVTCI